MRFLPLLLVSSLFFFVGCAQHKAAPDGGSCSSCSSCKKAEKCSCEACKKGTDCDCKGSCSTGNCPKCAGKDGAKKECTKGCPVSGKSCGGCPHCKGKSV